jgi:hypothetical protein
MEKYALEVCDGRMIPDTRYRIPDETSIIKQLECGLDESGTPLVC